MISLTEDNRMLGYESLCSYSNISHFVTTRQGGHSEGTYASFNCSHYCGDDQDSVRRNRELLIEVLPQKPREFIVPEQTHDTEIRLIGQEYLASSSEQKQEMLYGVDAIITHEPGCCLCISTADCVPILLYDKKQQVVAAVHAGWRGTVAGILSSTLEKMKGTFGTEAIDVIACIGPSISSESFEVGEEVYEAFQKKGFDMSRISFWNETTGKHHIDLWEANRIQLLAFGVPESQIELAGICTYIHSDEFFSARQLGIKSGRMLSGISLLIK